MKLQQQNKKINKSGKFVESGFNIAANSKAFRILSDTLYSNKIGAIIRELSCNAYDSHVMAGTVDKPFNLHLPTALEPWFEIRDFGVGLTPDQIQSTYTTYFLSDKDHSDDFIGQLGLGSKSPFAYTESFTVKSCCQGNELTYTAYISEEGLPMIALICSTSSKGKPNGVSVQFAVEQKDIDKFEDEYFEQLKWFKVPPEVNSSRQFKKIKTKHRHKNCIIPDVYIHKENKPTIIMGNVGYPINVEVFDDGRISQFLYNDPIIEVPIGTVDVTASRESLSYNKQSVQKLTKVLNDIIDDILADVHKAIAPAKSLFEASKIYNDLGTNIKDYFNVTPEFNGKALEFNFSIDKDKYRNVMRLDGLGNYSKYQHISTSFPLFYIDVSNGRERLHTYIKQNNTIVQYVQCDPALFPDLLKDTGLIESDFIRTSTLPKPTPKPRQKKDQASLPKYVHCYSSKHRYRYRLQNRSYLKHEQISTTDTTTSYHYILLDSQYNIKINDKLIGPQDFFDKIRHTSNTSYRIYAIQNKTLPLIQQLPNWQPLFPQYLNNLIDTYNQLGVKATKSQYKGELIHVPLPDNTVDVRFNTFAQNRRVNKNSDDTLYNIIVYFGGNVETDDDYDINKEAQYVLTEYPLLDKINRWNVQEQDILRYVNAIFKEKTCQVK